MTRKLLIVVGIIVLGLVLIIVFAGDIWHWFFYDEGTPESYLQGPVEEAWVARYRCDGNGFNRIEAMVMDGQGNIYVTGKGDFNGSRDDYVTTKYNSKGEQIWLARYDGAEISGSWDSAHALALDEAGNVYVAGGSWNSEYHYDGVTIKYDETGNQLWVARHTSGVRESTGMQSVDVDSDGNVYVTGKGGTVKYDSQGKQLWDRETQGSKVIVDQVGDIYVMATDGIVKYDASGDLLWTADYYVAHEGVNVGLRDMIVDGEGNVYAAGSSNGRRQIVKYDKEGNTLWSDSSGAINALTLDPSGNMYATGGSAKDYLTIKYDANGNRLWTASYDTPSDAQDSEASDSACDIVVDGSGNVYVTGQGERGCATVKYDSDGNELWSARYYGGVAVDIGQVVALDQLGNVYIAGTTEVARYWNGSTYTEYTDFLIIKYTQ